VFSYLSTSDSTIVVPKRRSRQLAAGKISGPTREQDELDVMRPGVQWSTASLANLATVAIYYQ